MRPDSTRIFGGTIHDYPNAVLYTTNDMSAKDPIGHQRIMEMGYKARSELTFSPLVELPEVVKMLIELAPAAVRVFDFCPNIGGRVIVGYGRGAGGRPSV